MWKSAAIGLTGRSIDATLAPRPEGVVRPRVRVAVDAAIAQVDRTVSRGGVAARRVAAAQVAEDTVGRIALGGIAGEGIAAAQLEFDRGSHIGAGRIAGERVVAAAREHDSGERVAGG